jgi:hypothetical protein
MERWGLRGTLADENLGRTGTASDPWALGDYSASIEAGEIPPTRQHG